MEFRQLGGSGFKVPALCLGTGTFGGKNELMPLALDQKVGTLTRKITRFKIRRAHCGLGRICERCRRRLEPSFACIAQPPDDEVRFRCHRLTNASVR